MLLQTGDNPRRSRIARFFGLGESIGSGRFKHSGFPSLPNGDAEQVTEVLIGGLMAFRKKVLVEIDGFDENLELVSSYCYMEDQDIAFRVRSSGWEIRYLPKASFYHFPSSNGRDDPRTIIASKVFNSRYLLEKNFGLGTMRRLAWWWAMVGLCLVEAKVHGRKGLSGVLLGIMEVCSGGLKRRIIRSRS
jgi:GT2 family glycosyltransferase